MPLAERRQATAEWLAAGAIIAAQVLLVLVTREREATAILSGVHLLFAAFARSAVRRNASAVRALAVGVSVVMLLWCGASLCYERHKAAVSWLGRDYNFEAFRFYRNQEQWPLYGRPGAVRWPQALAMVPAAALLAWWAIGIGPRLKNRRVAVAGLCVASALAMIAFGFGDRPERTLAVYHDGLFADDYIYLQANGIGLDGYVAAMDDLSWFGTHYPPGLMLLYGPSPGVGAVVVLLASAASVGLAYGAARAFGIERPGAWCSAALLATAPLVLMQPTLSSSAAFVAPAAGGLWLCAIVMRSPSRPRALVASASVGVLLAGWSFFSFGVGLYAMALGLALVGCVAMGRASIRRGVAAGTIVAGATGLALIGLYLATSYDTLAGFREASANHYDQIGGRLVPPREWVSRWLLRGAGNAIAPLVGHLPLTVTALLGLAWPDGWRRRAMATLAGAASVAVVLYASFDGTFVLETERIWMFFLPALALPAGAWLADRDAGDSRGAAAGVILLSLALATAQEFLWSPYL